MSSKRRTFHVDWDSPSHETGTVKRRPASLNASFSNNRYENTEYCGPRFFETTGSRAKGPIASDVARTKESVAVKDEKYAQLLEPYHPREKGAESLGQNDHSDETQTPRPAKEGARKDFGLTLPCEPFECKNVVRRTNKFRSLESGKSRSLIPRLKMRKSSGTRGLVNSSSESSGFGSPLSPLSPQQDPPIGKDTSKGIIKISDSKSSGLGSPGSPAGSPLSPESHEYSAFHLIQLQLEKLRNCLCEKRQAEVISD